MFLVPTTQESRTLEDPRQSLLDWPEESGNVADTGQQIDRKTALSYSPVFRAVDLISDTIAKAPFYVYRGSQENKELSTQHPAYSLLLYKPNNNMTSFTFWKTILLHVLLDPGNAYVHVIRNGAGQPQSLELLEPTAVAPAKRNGELRYTVHVTDQDTPAILLPENVLHFKGVGWNGLTGMSVLEYARNSFSTGIGAQKFGNKYFRNNAESRVVLEYPSWLTEDQAEAVKKSWNNAHKGLDNVHSTAIIQGGMTAKQISSSAKDSQLIELLQWSVKDVSNWFGVPPHKLGDASRTAYNSLEQENQAFLDDTIDPWFVMIERECRDKLLSGEQKRRDSHFLAFDREALVRANLSARADYYNKGLAGHPWLYVDEVRNRENMNGVGIDDVRPPVNNFAPATGEDDTDDTDETEQNTDTGDGKLRKAKQAADNVLRERYEAMERRIRTNLQRAAKKHDAQSFPDVLDEVWNKHKETVREAMTPAAETVAELSEEGTEDILERNLNFMYESFRG